MSIENAIALARPSIQDHESWRTHAYSDKTGRELRDPEGDLTIGWGFNIEQDGLPQVIGDAWLDYLLQDRAIVARNFARAAFDRLTDDQQAVLVELAYMLGASRLAKFEQMRAALEAGDAPRAAAELKDSRTYQELPARVEVLAQRLAASRA